MDLRSSKGPLMRALDAYIADLEGLYESPPPSQPNPPSNGVASYQNGNDSYSDKNGAIEKPYVVVIVQDVVEQFQWTRVSLGAEEGRKASGEVEMLARERVDGLGIGDECQIIVFWITPTQGTTSAQLPHVFHFCRGINEAATSSPGASFFVATSQDAINKTAALIEFHNAFSACHGILLVGYHVSEMPESKIYALDIPKIDASKSVEASREVERAAGKCYTEQSCFYSHVL